MCSFTLALAFVEERNRPATAQTSTVPTVFRAANLPRTIFSLSEPVFVFEQNTAAVAALPVFDTCSSSRFAVPVLPIFPMFYEVEPTMVSNRLKNVGGRSTPYTQAWNAHEWDLKL